MLHRRQILGGLLITAVSPRLAEAANPRWAVPLTGMAGLANLNRVTENLYRSAQPTAEGFITAQNTLGISTVVNLRNEKNSDDAALARGTHLTLVRVQMSAWNAADEDNPKLALAIHAIRQGVSRGKVLVHCKYGADRTGAVIAAYRMVEQGWSADEAAAELTGGGFGYHRLWLHLGREIKALDVKKLRREVAAIPL